MCHIAGGLLTMLQPHQACLPRAADGAPISSQVVRLMLSALPPPMPAPAGRLLPPHHCSPSLAEVVWRLVAPPYAVGVPLRLPPHISPANLQREITMKQICVWHRLSPYSSTAVLDHRHSESACLAPTTRQLARLQHRFLVHVRWPC